MSRALAVLLLVLGVAVIVRTIIEGVGGGLGLLIGAVLLIAGALRLYVSRLR